MTLYAQGSGNNSEFRGATLYDAPLINLQASQNDFSPPPMTECSALLINAQVTTLSITGFAHDRSGRHLKIVCAATSKFPFTLVSGSGSSAANHVLNLGGNIVMTAGSVVNLYCPVGGGSGWYLDSSSLASGGGGGSGTVTSVSVPDDFTVATPTVAAAISHGALQVFASPAGTQNNVDPTSGGAWPVGFDRVDVTLAGGAATWTGIAAGQDGQVIILTNTDAANNLTLAIQNAGSTAANRFRGVAGSTVLLPGNAIMLKYYGGSVARWVVVP
jgi:hypothetical protein